MNPTELGGFILLITMGILMVGMVFVFLRMRKTAKAVKSGDLVELAKLAEVKSGGSKRFFMCFGAVFFILGIIISYFGFSTIKLAIASESWPTVEGKVIKSEINSVKRRVKREERTVTETHYIPIVSYSYTTNGAPHISNKVSFVEFSYDETCSSCANAIRNKYPKDTIVKVHYNPEKPGEAVLEAGLQMRTFSELAVGIIFSIAGTLFFLLGLHGKEISPGEMPIIT